MGTLLIRIIFLAAACLSAGCAGVYREMLGKDTDHPYTRIFKSDFDSAWNATLQALKYATIPEKKPESGTIVTEWIDNTAEKNFTESFGDGDQVLKAQYRFKILITRVPIEKQMRIKIDVRKEQLVQHDELEGWRSIESDTYDENTLLYRIGRILYVLQKTQTITANSPATSGH